MDKAETINRIWLIFAISCPLTYYLVYNDNKLFIWTMLIGSLALFHAEWKSNWFGWDHGLVLVAHIIALFTLFASITFIFIFYIFASFTHFNSGLAAVIIMFVSLCCTGYAHSKVQGNYDKVRKQLEENINNEK